ncbi:unnamed protein product [Dibothriocephalus latus]|uniref:Uncharacterized protein n=1 Tax=Dibothriocephalus latus TaxID=60516 RepID=A0A3P7NKT3_DIBLA|nr:unnamed protein product [Dibothriocephalus latus]
MSTLCRVFVTPKPPLPGKSTRDDLGRLRLLYLAAFPGWPSDLTDGVLAAQFRAGALDDNFCHKLTKKPKIPSEDLLIFVQQYEEQFRLSLTTPFFLCIGRSVKGDLLGGDPNLSKFYAAAPGTLDSCSLNSDCVPPCADCDI